MERRACLSYLVNFQWDDGSYMSALGGAVSLYLGISLAMMFEVLELIVDVVVNFFATKFGNKSK